MKTRERFYWTFSEVVNEYIEGSSGGNYSRYVNYPTFANLIAGMQDDDEYLTSAIYDSLLNALDRGGDELLVYILALDPIVLMTNSDLSADSSAYDHIQRKFWEMFSWIGRTAQDRSVKIASLDQTVNSLLADSKRIIAHTGTDTTETVSDEGTETKVEGDALTPITESFPNMASPSLSDRLNALRQARNAYNREFQQDFTHGETITESNPQGLTLMQKIDEVLAGYANILDEWTRDFIDEFELVARRELDE